MILDEVDAEVLLGDGTEESCPRDIEHSSSVFDIGFHPSAPFLAAGLVSGGIVVHEFRRNESRIVGNYQSHESGVTSVEFTEDGTHLVSASSAPSISVMDCSTQQTVVRVRKGKLNPHKLGISCINVCSETLLATGDDDGLIVVWDLRQRKAVTKYHEHGDLVTQILFFSEVDQLLSSSGDTCLGVFDMRRNAFVDCSEPRPDELYCMAFVPATNDIICGTPSGTLPVWRYGAWSRPYDSHKHHPRECEAITTYNDNILLTGACDSVVRVVQAYPAREVLCHLGGDAKKRGDIGQGISRIRISHDRQIIATSSQGRFVKFHDIAFLGSEEELDKLRSKAEARHMAIIRRENEEASARAEPQEEEVDSEAEWTSSSSDDEKDDEGDDDDDDDDDQPNDEEVEETPAVVEGEAVATAPTVPSRRAEKRARVAAAKWLKNAQKEHINFKRSRRKKRTSEFWSDLQ